MFIYKSRLNENIQIHDPLHLRQEIFLWATSARAQVGGWSPLKLQSYYCPVSLYHFQSWPREPSKHLTVTLNDMRWILLSKSWFCLEWKGKSAWPDYTIFSTFLPQNSVECLNIPLQALSNESKWTSNFGMMLNSQLFLEQIPYRPWQEDTDESSVSMEELHVLISVGSERSHTRCNEHVTAASQPQLDLFSSSLPLSARVSLD